ncbi:single-stranded DNA-binding protein [Litoribacter ruber]|uniref:Single-stranded DNA-binding protein n=1 Tax=Litoribacter ruber TaxID=702568 RepID=A0AAP2CJ73_9BACT|nr:MULTISPECIES: single-stranded DNA-binding protein [Litoribacter]MBS9524694.1 single-stranded DNA-binding protein [Litoribacter alkaliphilus]MBT0812714.1 single-stranded DNA-binding protein [Litoribacter ruber]
MNSVKLIGRLGSKPDVKTFENNRKMVRLNLATNESYKTAKGEFATETNWHNVVAWGKQAEYLEEKADKGSEISVEGKLVTRTYNDKDGAKKWITEVVANEVSIVEKKEASV